MKDTAINQNLNQKPSVPYVTYKKFKLGDKYIKPPEHALNKELLTRLEKLKHNLEEKEKAKFKEAFLYQRAPSDWSRELKKYLGQGYENYTEPGAFRSAKRGFDITIGGIESYNSKQEIQEMKDKFSGVVLRDFQAANDNSMYSLFPVDSGQIKLATDIIYDRLYKLYKSGFLKITKTGFQFNSKYKRQRNMIGGLLFEAFEGIAKGGTVKSTHNMKGTVSNTTLTDVADYYIEGIGYEEVKRSVNFDKDIIKETSFHLGSFSTGGALRKNTGGEKLKEDLAKAIWGIIFKGKDVSGNFRQDILDSLTVPVIDYIEWRIQDVPNATREGDIFWFLTRKGVILGSEFIQGIIDYHKLYIKGSATFVNSDTGVDFRKSGFKDLYNMILAMSDYTEKSEDMVRGVIKDVIADSVKDIDTGKLISSINYQLDYGGYSKYK